MTSDLFDRVLRERHDEAVVGCSCSWSGDELLWRAAGAAARLGEQRIRAGGVVPALFTTSPTALAFVLAGMRAGTALAPLGPRLPVDELADATTALDAEVLLAEPASAELAGEVAERTGCRLLVIDAPPPPLESPPMTWSGSQVAVVFHTSGTTGRPKAVRASMAALDARVRTYSTGLDLRPGDRYWTASPFHHVAGLAMHLMALGAGATVIAEPGFSPSHWCTLVDHAPTHCLLVPTMIDTLLGEGRLGVVQPRVLQYGAAPIQPDLLAEAMAALPDTDLVQMFGQTEGSPVCWLSPEDHRRAVRSPDLLASVGRPAPGVELLVDAADHGIGEVVARAAHFFHSDADGWLRTGDLGRVDGDGYVYLSGRRGDKIVRGGENIYPAEVEAVLAAHPGVREVVVVGRPDRHWGETVVAVLVPTDADRPPNPEDLRAYARARLAGYKVPVEWELRADLPRNAAGKVLRRRLIEPTAPAAAAPVEGSLL